MSLRVEALSRVCYEAGRAYAKAVGDVGGAPWMEAPEIVQRSMMALVRAAQARPDARAEELFDYIDLSYQERVKRDLALAIIRAAAERPVLS